MDGRRLTAWLLAAGVTAAAGCRTTSQSTPADGGLGGLTSRSGFKPTAPPADPVVAKVKSKAKGIKPETEVAFAETELDAALVEGRPANERDALFDRARARYQKVLEKDPKNRDALAGLAKLYTRSNDKARATQVYDALLKANPKDHELAFQKARMLAHFEDWAGAAQAGKLALAADPENLKYPKAVAYYTAQAGGWDEAFAMLLKKMPEADARFFLGRVLLDLDRIPEGREQMTLALKADPRHADAQGVLAMLDAPPPPLPPAGVTPEPIQQTGATAPQQ